MHTVVSSYIVPYPLDGVTAPLHLRITQKIRCHHGSTHNADLPWEARSGRSHSCSFDHRRRRDTLRTAMAITGGLLFGEILSGVDLTYIPRGSLRGLLYPLLLAG